ncbi:hypothetical protein GQ44DRAFT_731704 [Phaeosphaeriaceae sp. PMI808]|nr:hypothetical protein GQ44DRAFT_731704 [Phaeosphaeriaceae sp. PMI808]
MCASMLSDEKLFDNFIDHPEYDSSQKAIALSSLQVAASPPCIYAPASFAQNIQFTIPHTTAHSHNTSHNYPTAPDVFENPTDPLYFFNQEGFEAEFAITFGSSHIEKLDAEVDILGPYQAFASEAMDYDKFPFLESIKSEEAWYKYDLNADESFGDFTTCCTSPSSASTSNADTIYHERTSVSGRDSRSSKFESFKFQSSRAPRSPFRTSAHRTPPITPTASLQNDSTLIICRRCNRSFTLTKDLRRHITSIHGKQEFHCPEPGCGRRFNRKDKLLFHCKKHCRTHSNAQSSVQGDGPSNTPSNVLHTNILGIDTESVPMPSDSGNSLDSLHVGVSSAVQGDISQYSEDKNKPFTCVYCSQKFNLRHDHLRHMRTLHSKQENGVVYRCAAPDCNKWDKIWTRLDNFKKHLAKQHDAESITELVQKSRVLGSSEDFTITTPEMFSQ